MFRSLGRHCCRTKTQNGLIRSDCFRKCRPFRLLMEGGDVNKNKRTWSAKSGLVCHKVFTKRRPSAGRPSQCCGGLLRSRRLKPLLGDHGVSVNVGEGVKLFDTFVSFSHHVVHLASFGSIKQAGEQKTRSLTTMRASVCATKGRKENA